ncbi:MAG: hypothetical protein LUC22_03050 [Prevotella sp.]|nr:hypothetical protein [Prevotella sp.]
MNKHLNKVFAVLRTREDVKALGFNRKELRGVAAEIAGKLNLKDDATDEETDDAIDEGIEAVLPYLRVSQSVAERRFNSLKDSLNKKPGEDDTDGDDKPDTSKTDPKKDKEGDDKADSEGNEQFAALAKALEAINKKIDANTAELNALKQGKTADTRRDRVKALVKDTGSFGDRTLKAFARMAFKDDEEFDDYLDDVRSDLDAVNKERAEKGLDKLGAIPPTGKGGGKGADTQLLTEADVKRLAGK